MSEIEESDSDGEKSESDHGNGWNGQAVLISCRCRCQKCLDLESFCCFQFPKIKKECQDNGE